jgi:membrane-associated phospholipid phosphatase
MGLDHHPLHGRPASRRAVRPAGQAFHVRVPRVTWARLGWLREVLLLVLADAVYEVCRGLSRGSASAALADAHRVAGAERAVGLDIEGSVQHAFSGTPWLTALDWVYLGAQSFVAFAGVVLVYRLSRRVYRVLRTTLIATWALALPVYALFPTAPPRLAGLGLSDTVSTQTPMRLDSGSISLLNNPYAAVPSLHAAFAVAVGVAVVLSARSWALRLLGAIWGPIVVLAVLATGNHFALDVAAGLVLAAIGLAVALRLTSRAAATA